jgi:hypothetical protein
MTPAAFLACYPEFRRTDPTLVTAKLTQAAAQMGGPDPTVWGPFADVAQPGQPQGQTIADVAHGALAAHLLITSPFGTDMRLDPKSKGRSSYLDVFDEMRLAVASGPQVAGATPAVGGWRGF